MKFSNPWMLYHQNYLQIKTVFPPLQMSLPSSCYLLWSCDLTMSTRVCMQLKIPNDVLVGRPFVPTNRDHFEPSMELLSTPIEIKHQLAFYILICPTILTEQYLTEQYLCQAGFDWVPLPSALYLSSFHHSGLLYAISLSLLVARVWCESMCLFSFERNKQTSWKHLQWWI